MSKNTLKDWFYLEMVLHGGVNDIMQTLKKEVDFFFSVCCIVFNCSWQLIMFDKKQKNLYKTYSFSNWWWFIQPKSFWHGKNCFFFFNYPLWMMANLSIISSCVVNFTYSTQILELFEKLEKVKPNFVSLSAKNQVLILLYGSWTNSQNLNQEICKNVIFYLKATTCFDRPFIDF